MCELNAYMMDKDQSRLIMEAVDTVEPVEKGLCLTNIWGDQKVIHAKIHSIALGQKSIFLKAAAPDILPPSSGYI